MDRVTFSIDTRTITAAPGTSVLEAARQNDIYIPHLCYHPDLEPAAVCRLCMVEVEGRGTALACRTTIEEGMAVNTHNDRIDLIRRVALELLIADHRGDCLSCTQNNDCQLQRAAAYVGIEPERLGQLRPTTEMLPVDDSNPFFDHDPNKCILCGICVRTCNKLQGVGAIDFISRGYDTTVSTFGRGRLADSRCESCGECVVRCPVGALAPKKARQPSREVKTVCPYCGVGCGFYLGIRGGQVVGARGDRDNVVNRGRLCVKGRFGHGFVNHPARLTSPLVRKDGELVESTWDEALGLMAEKFSQSKGQAFAMVSSAKCTNEENYLLQKFTRVVMGTNSIDHCARL